MCISLLILANIIIQKEHFDIKTTNIHNYASPSMYHRVLRPHYSNVYDVEEFYRKRIKIVKGQLHLDMIAVR